MNRVSSNKIFGVNKIFILLSLLILFHITNNLIILYQDNTPLLWDGGDYFYKSLRYYDVFANIDSDFFSKFNEVSTYRPPLFLLTSLPLYLILGKSTDVAVMTNFIYIVILILSVYGIGKRIHSEKMGLLASFIVSFFPILFGLSRSYWLDFPLTAMVSLSIYLLIRTDYLRVKKYCIFFGISFGLGMLTKWTHFVFLTGPIIYTLVLSLRPEVNSDIKPGALAKNIMYAILSAIVISSFWYIPNGINIVVQLFHLSTGMTGQEATRFQQLGETIGPSGIFNMKSLSYFAGKLVNDQISFFFASLFMIFTFFLAKQQRSRDFWLLIFWILIPLFAFTLIKNKTPRNTVPMLPAISLLISMGIMNIRTLRTRMAVTTGILIFGIFQYTVISYGSSLLPEKIALNFSIGDMVFFQQNKNPSYAIFRSNKGDWKADEILDSINIDRGDKKNIKIVLLPRDQFTWMAMEYTSYLKEMPFTFVGAVDSPEAVMDADYVMVKKGGFVAPWFLMDNVHKAFDLMEEHRKEFSFLTSFILPEERTFLPVYDIKTNRKGHRCGVIFSNKIEVVDYKIFEEQQREGKKFILELTVKGIENITGEQMVIFNLLNKKMERLLKKAVKPTISLSGLKTSEERVVNASITMPIDKAKDFFSLEIGFYDDSLKKLLTYRPEYLIYKRKNS